jgi:glycosyltransferase involved in cell wall biosynthesis
MTIVRIIRSLEEFGHRNTIWIVDSQGVDDASRIRKMIQENYLPLRADVRSLSGHLDNVRGDAVIATHCWTAYPARAITNVRERFYFIQDFEPYFYPMGSRYLLAEDTYRFGFSCIAASTWLRDLMRSQYDANADYFELAYDPSVYFPDDRVPRKNGHLAFYARIGTERRLVELGLLALELVARQHPNLVVHFFGDWLEDFNPPYAYQNHGVLAEKELADLYRRVSIGLVFSSSNYSLIPNEMMACGLPVVEIESPSTSAVFANDVVTLAQPTPSGIADAIVNLLENPGLREQRRVRGLQHVKDLSWEQSARRVEAALQSGILARSPSDHAALLRDAARKRPVSKRSNHVAARRSSSFQRPIVFVGQPEYFRQTYYDETSVGSSFEFPITSGDPSALKDLPQFVKERGARTCIIFRPEWLAWYPKAFDKLRAEGVVLIGYSTEPVPHNWVNPHSDQLKRLESLKGALQLDYDLIIHFDQWSLDLLDEVGFKRIIAHPLPVSERLFFPEDRPREFDVCFLGRSTPHREEFLVPLKARYNTLHVAHGLTDDEARVLMNRSKMVVNLHTHEYLNFETRPVMALRCQRPLVSEQLSGDYLVVGRDYTLVTSPEDLRAKVAEVMESQLVPPATADLSMFSIEALFAKLGVE